MSKPPTEKKKIRSDLRCENCQHRESTTLLYWEKYHIESGRISLIKPSFICTECSELFKGNNALYQDLPRLVPFDVIANQWDNRIMGLTNKKTWEFSCFRNPYFRKRIWRIRFAFQPEKDAKEENHP